MELRVIAGSDSPPSWSRRFARLETDWCRGVAEPIDVVGGTVFSSQEFPGCVEANSVANAWIPPGMDWSQLVAGTEIVNRGAGLRWWTNPSMPVERTGPVETGLTAAGWRRVARPLLRWIGDPAPPPNVAGCVIVPSRSAYAAFADFHGDEIAVKHLDDPLVESWVALSVGRAVGVATVQISAQEAALREWRVDPSSSAIGIQSALLGRVLDMCQRSEVKALLAVTDAAAPLVSAGFEVLGEWVEFRAAASPDVTETALVVDHAQDG
jgi:hypothetical protein